MARRTGKAISLTVTINPASRKKATQSLAFSDEGWGRVTWSYLTSIKNLTHDQLAVIFDDAKQFTIDWLWSGSQTLRTGSEPGPDRGFRVQFSNSPDLNLIERFRFGEQENLDLRF